MFLEQIRHQQGHCLKSQKCTTLTAPALASQQCWCDGVQCEEWCRPGTSKAGNAGNAGRRWCRGRSPRYLGWRMENWEANFQDLKDFMDMHGHGCVPGATHAALATWIGNQRHKGKSGTMSAERKQRLNDIGFHWSGKLAREHMVSLQAESDEREGASRVNWQALARVPSGRANSGERRVLAGGKGAHVPAPGAWQGPGGALGPLFPRATHSDRSSRRRPPSWLNQDYEGVEACKAGKRGKHNFESGRLRPSSKESLPNAETGFMRFTRFPSVVVSSCMRMRPLLTQREVSCILSCDADMVPARCEEAPVSGTPAERG